MNVYACSLHNAFQIPDNIFETPREQQGNTRTRGDPGPPSALPAPDPGSLDDYIQEVGFSDGDPLLPFSGEFDEPPVPTEEVARGTAAEGSSLEESVQASLGVPPEATMSDLRIAQQFIAAVRSATLEETGLDPDVLARLRNPPTTPLASELTDPDFLFALDVFLGTTNASDDTYNTVRSSYLRRHPTASLPSLYQLKKRIVELTGVTPVKNDMCPDSCLAYTGPFSGYEHCPECGGSRYDPVALQESGGKKKIPRRVFYTLPPGPQIQAQWRTEEGARNMRHRERETARIVEELRRNGGQLSEYNDVYHGSDYLETVLAGKIKNRDTVLMLSMDGAQLYRNKQSDCWMYIWVILNLAPDLRYKVKYVLPGAFIPGPNKPKNIDSFLLPGISHLSALHNAGGLRVWDAVSGAVFSSKLFLALVTADGPGMTYLNGLVGHQGAQGCRLYCEVRGRHKPGGTNYYPALLKPHNYDVQGCDHPSTNIRVVLLSTSSRSAAVRYDAHLRDLLAAENENQYKRLRLRTGIAKPSIFSGLSSDAFLGIPCCFPADQMHLISLNVTDLLLALFRGTLPCEKTDSKAEWHWAVLVGDVWKAHGCQVAACTPYLPGSFDRPPRNPAEKISSGYKAWEYLLYIFGLGPLLFYATPLPEIYYRNFCKLVRGVRLVLSRRIPRDNLRLSQRLLVEFVEGYERLYYQQRTDRLHFVRQSIHAIPHMPGECERAGPQSTYTQWTMERTIGNLGQEIKQHSDPYMNLSERGARRAQVNALKAMIPYLDPDEHPLPRGAEDLGGGFVLLRAAEENPSAVTLAEGEVLRRYLEGAHVELSSEWIPRVARWARLRLPNGQVARSLWKEARKPLSRLRIARNVKVNIGISDYLMS